MKRVWLVNAHGDDDPTLVRIASVAIASWATRGEQGVDVGDERHELVTEGRYKQWFDARAAGSAWARRMVYSSCGDLAHWVIRCLGVRDEAILNRNDDGGTHDWIPGANVTWLSRARKYHRADRTHRCGDIVFVDNVHGGHIQIVGPQWAGESDVACYEYGQPCGRMHRKRVEPGKLGPNQIEYVVDVVTLPRVRSAIVPDGFVGGEPSDELEYGVSVPAG